MGASLLLLITAAAAALGSPGPMPLALAATGASFGVRPGIPFLIGAVLGLVAVGALSALGVSAIIAKGGLLVGALFALSMTYFAYVAYRIATSPIAGPASKAAEAPRLIDGLIINLTNPKAYLAFLALLAGFTLPVAPLWLSVVLTLAVILAVATFVDALWLMAGGALAPIFGHPRLGRWLRIGFAVVMLGTLGLVLWASLPS